MPRKSDKRERLLKAARSLIHRQGFHQATLADISELSGVSIGNMYYYFKTKEEIIAAVIEDRTERFQALTESWEQESDPRERLGKFLDMPMMIRESIAKHGCPVGSLSQELNKFGDVNASLATKPLNAQLEWVTEQFRQMGREDATAMGRQFISALQGASLLANALNESDVLVEQIGRIRGWVNAL